jgi:hypothetical protein
MFYAIRVWTSLLGNPSKAGFLNKRSCLAAALSVTEFEQTLLKIWSHFGVLLMSDLDVELTTRIGLGGSLLNKCSRLARALGVAYYTNMRDMNWITLRCVT